MSDAAHISETGRRRQDGGRAARAWRWFSDRTIRSAERYRDVPWRIVAMNGAAAGFAILLSRVDPRLAISPWLLIGGGIWMLFVVRMAAFKLVDAALRR